VTRHQQDPDWNVRAKGGTVSYDILKNLGLDRVDAGSPDFLKTLERMQREAWQSLQREERDAPDRPPTDDIVLG
jgi:hypothetical protein